MKVLAINSSPLKSKGNTHMILEPFLEGAKEAGAETELLFTMDLDIKPCIGDFSCWHKTPGKCIQKDDMESVLEKVQQADIIVFATPLYVEGMTGPMKNMMDRMIPMVTPVIEIRDDHCGHPVRDDQRRLKMVLVSNCGFWELDNFDVLVAHMEAIAKNFADFAGSLLRPHGPALKGMIQMGMDLSSVFDACRDAGRQVVESGTISEETLKEISKDLIPRDVYVESANAYTELLSKT